jgi:hypothetical protein
MVQAIIKATQKMGHAFAINNHSVPIQHGMMDA